MFRILQLIPRTQRTNLVRLWKRVSWLETATDHPRVKYSDYHKIGTLTTPGWPSIVEQGILTPQGKAEAAKGVHP